MPYFIETFDKPDHQQVRLDNRPAHLEFLAEHKDLLLACGAKLADGDDTASGGVYLLDVETRAEAEDFIARDPFTRAELFAEVKITRWRKAYLAGQGYL
ncbi:YciI family protein [Saccharopolyspora hirsuta]|uniref:YciI family protein n=1 Tax=Saccharopolyspora hirsuta TaxID=1837 RepID=A0A5M7BY39_SACHI|nr:YciI family protein [Saccharopolyspora hirsuta]KAA5834403.1 YciI family protein [Saccharopolyspora hirsuta]